MKRNIILSLFDYTGNWSRPYRENGYEVIQIDMREQIAGNIGGVKSFARKRTAIQSAACYFDLLYAAVSFDCNRFGAALP